LAYSKYALVYGSVEFISISALALSALLLKYLPYTGVIQW